MGKKGKSNEKRLSDILPLDLGPVDEALGGGILRSRGYMIKGNTMTGKSVLAMHMQYAALERGEGCIYVTIRQPFWRVILYFERFKCWNIKQYINQEKLFITDISSLSMHPDKGPIEDKLRELELQGYKRIRDVVSFINEGDDEARLQAGIEQYKKKGPGGVNIIDALSDQLQFAKDPEKQIRFHEKAREVFASFGNQGTGFHLYAPDQLEASKSLIYAQIIDGFQDGTIEVRYDLASSGRQKHYIRVAGIRGWSGPTSWHEFSISSDKGITVLEPVPTEERLNIDKEIQAELLRTLKNSLIVKIHRLEEVIEGGNLGKIDEGRLLKMKSSLEEDMLHEIDEIEKGMNDGKLSDILRGMRLGTDSNTLTARLVGLSEERGWKDDLNLGSKNKRPIVVLTAQVVIRALDDFLKNL